MNRDLQGKKTVAHLPSWYGKQSGVRGFANYRRWMSSLVIYSKNFQQGLLFCGHDHDGNFGMLQKVLGHASHE